MLVAVVSQMPSPESRLIERTLALFPGVEIRSLSYPFGGQAYSDRYDIAFCVGPVSYCPCARRRVGFLLGPVELHANFEYNVVLCGSSASARRAIMAWGLGVKCIVLEIPVLETEAGRRRCLELERSVVIGLPWAGRCSLAYDAFVLAGGLSPVHVFACWTPPSGLSASLFTSSEFNCRVRHGGVGVYGSSVGFELLVRRHLALGGLVFCNRDKKALGDFSDFCMDVPTRRCLVDLELPDPVVVEEAKGDVEMFRDGLFSVLMKL